MRRALRRDRGDGGLDLGLERVELRRDRRRHWPRRRPRRPDRPRRGASRTLATMILALATDCQTCGSVMRLRRLLHGLRALMPACLDDGALSPEALTRRGIQPSKPRPLMKTILPPTAWRRPASAGTCGRRRRARPASSRHAVAADVATMSPRIEKLPHHRHWRASASSSGRRRPTVQGDDRTDKVRREHFSSTSKIVARRLGRMPRSTGRNAQYTPVTRQPKFRVTCNVLPLDSKWLLWHRPTDQASLGPTKIEQEDRTRQRRE